MTTPTPIERDNPALLDALLVADSILSLLHHRGLVDSESNRQDVATALVKIEPFARVAAQRIRQLEAHS